MNHTYHIEGVTCTNCVNKVSELLGSIKGINSVKIDPGFDSVEISMESHIPFSLLNDKLNGTKYRITEEADHKVTHAEEEERPSLKAYSPVLLLFGYITIATIGIQWAQHHFNFMQWMSHFMGGFFLAFSYFKLLDIPAFASSYSSYDIIAKRWLRYGYIYPFIELALGLLFITGLVPFFANTVTLAIMGISTIGVINSLLKKRKIQCACMGAVFNLPMSTITLIEDLLMVIMSAVMLLIME